MYNSIGVAEFYQASKKERLPIIDVREKEEYARGHVPNAINMPLSSLNENYQELDKDTDYYIICQTGGRSATASRFLAEQGYDVTNVMGGTSAYQGALEK